MPRISLHVSVEEKIWIESYAKLHGLDLSEAVKSVIFEKLEDEYDLRTIEQYEKEKAKGNTEYYTLEEVKKELGL